MRTAANPSPKAANVHRSAGDRMSTGAGRHILTPNGADPYRRRNLLLCGLPLRGRSSLAGERHEAPPQVLILAEGVLQSLLYLRVAEVPFVNRSNFVPVDAEETGRGV